MPAHAFAAAEKAPLLPAGGPQRRARASPPWARALLGALLLLVGASLWQGGSALAPALRPASSFSWLAAHLEAAAAPHSSSSNSDCPQQAPHVGDYPTPIPSVDTYAERLSRAVQLDTSVGDNWPSPADDNERWQTRFEPFRSFLQEAFPRTHADDGPVRRELVNSHALLYTWQGSDKSLKPILLTAHQDVVPVDPQTVGSWRFPPFSGHYENGTVWGRGSHDAKAWVIGIMSTLEALLDPAAEFSPARTMIVAFGFDEEASGPHGGGHLAPALEERLGKDSVALLLDEGTPNFGKNDALGMPVAIVAVEEKGQAHIALRIDTPGGHSSGAPVHTSIGMLASILTAMEKAPEERRFPAGESAPLKQLLCLRHSPKMPDNVRRALRDLAWARRSSIEVNRASMSWLARAALALDSLTPSSGRDRRIKRAEQRVLEVLPRQLANPLFTTRAIDIIHGGTKINALPEGVEASIDHRIATWSNVEAVREMYRKLLRQAAKDFHLSLEAFGEDLSGKPDPAAPFLGKITVAEWAGSLEPAPRTPVVGKEAHAFRLLSSVIRDTYRIDEDGLPVTSGGEGVTVVPATMQGNTDTRYYWSLTRNIFRYGPASFAPDPTGLGTGFGVHSVNEHFTADARLVDFYSHLIRLVDADREL